MASLQVLLDRALATMAVGSQRDNRTVRAVASPFSEYVLRLSNQMGVLSAAALPLSSVRDLLHVAGWLYPCRMPSSPLSSDIKQDAVVAWNMCMVWATNFLSFNQCMSLAPFQLLVEARSRPRVPGALDWLESMADQLTPDAMQRLAASGYGGCALQVLLLWELLALGAIHGKLPPEVALQLLRPGVMRLAQRLALLTPHELPAAERSASPTTQAVADVSGITQVYGSLLALNWQQVVVASASTAPSSHPAIAGVWSQQQIGALQTYQDVWWGGVAALASSSRAAATTTTTTTTTSSSSSSSTAAALCPRYHVVWKRPDLSERCLADAGTKFGPRCLEMLLIQEAVGSLPWALQQLQPYRKAKQAGGNSTLLGDAGLWIQWPMLAGTVVNSSSTNSSSSSSISTNPSSSGASSAGTSGGSSSSSSSSSTCRCHAHTCHLCNPPPPVTLQQLQLVLELVCLTCQENTIVAQQAPLLLALLLQRAAPGVRAAFLNSADGVRLLVALQRMRAQQDVMPLRCADAWSWSHRHGALSTPKALGGTDLLPRVLGATGRAVYALAWCFLEADVGLPAAAPSAAARPCGLGPQMLPGAAGSTATGPGTRCAAKLPAAVAHGSVFGCPAAHFSSYLHTLEVPPTSLRLAAGVQPSLALFATLVKWMQEPTQDTLVLMFATLLAAIQPLVEPAAPGGSGCSHQAPAAGVAAAEPSTATSATPGPSSGSRHAATTGINNSSSSSSSSSTSDGATSSATRGSSSNSSSGSDLTPELLEAVSGAAYTASRLLMRAGPSPLPIHFPPRDRCISRQTTLLGAQVCNGVLQLALQQCVRYQQQPLEHLHVSKGALQLLEAAQRLLRFASVAGFAEVRQQLSCPAGATSTSEADTDAATSWMTSQERLDSTWLLFVLLHTGFVRLFALQEAASAVAAAALRRQEAMRAGQGAAGNGGGGGTSSASPAAAAGRVTGCACGTPTGGPKPWCPAHNSSPVPEATEGLSELTETQLITRIIVIHTSVADRVRSPLLLECSFDCCGGPVGPNPVGQLVANRRGVLCQGCGVARYCGPEHARLAWPAHRKVCGRLAAALGRRPAGSTGGGTSSSNNSTGSGSQVPRTSSLQQGRQFSDAQVHSLCLPKAAATGMTGSSSGSSGCSDST